MMLLVGGYSLRVTPGVKQRGWVAAVPTTALALTMPSWRPDPGCFGGFVYGSRKPLSFDERLLSELTTRAADVESLSAFEGSLLTDMCRLQNAHEFGQATDWTSLPDMIVSTVRWKPIANDQLGAESNWLIDRATKLHLNVTTRSGWVRGHPVLAAVALNDNHFPRDIRVSASPLTDCKNALPWSYLEHAPLMCGTGLPPVAWDDGLVTVGICRGNDQLDFECAIRGREHIALPADRWIMLKRDKHRLSFRSVDTLDQLMTGVELPELEQRLQESVTSVLCHDYVLWHQQKQYCVWFMDEHIAERILPVLSDATLALAIEVLDGEEVLARGEAWFAAAEFNNRWYLKNSRGCVIVHPVESASVDKIREKWKLRLRLRGDGLVALRNFDSHRYWQGQVELPLRVDLNSRYD
ncbi:MAG: hypothetical protein L0Y44_02835 [Phycisphaerales bacterium]|nr:hypothetical protein [Phycisphaerales bacterium]